MAFLVDFVVPWDSGVGGQPVYPAFPLVVSGCAPWWWLGRCGEGVVQGAAEQFVQAGSQGQRLGRCRTMRWAERAIRPGVLISWVQDGGGAGVRVEVSAPTAGVRVMSRVVV